MPLNAGVDLSRLVSMEALAVTLGFAGSCLLALGVSKAIMLLVMRLARACDRRDTLHGTPPVGTGSEAASRDLSGL